MCVRRSASKRPCAAEHAHAMLDVSDGLAVDAAHIARRSGVRCVNDLEQVPLAEGAELSDPSFGEDFELLAAVDRDTPFTEIGRCEEEPASRSPARRAARARRLGPLHGLTRPPSRCHSG